MPNYYDNLHTEEYACRECKWHGPGSSLVYGEIMGDGYELLCPSCDAYVCFVVYPTLEESFSNWDKLSPGERIHTELVKIFQDKFAAQKLSEPAQLPDIDAESFTLSWDFTNLTNPPETLIKYEDKLIFREPAFYEGYERFIEVAEILSARYGLALIDLVPTRESRQYLFGDRMTAIHVVSEARKRLFPLSNKGNGTL